MGRRLYVMKVTARNDIEAQLKQHMLQVLSLEIDPQPWGAEASLPEFLRDVYYFFAARLLGTSCLYMFDRGERSGTPAAIRKHEDEVKIKWPGEVVCVVAGIESARRRRLIDQGVAFVVPADQVCLPMLGVDLRERFRKVRIAGDTLSPASQAASLGYCSMTMSRAFDELQSAGLGRHFTAGKRRLMELDGPLRELWEKARPMMRRPVARRAVVMTSKDELERLGRIYVAA